MPLLQTILTVVVTLTLAEMMFSMGLRVSPAALSGGIRTQIRLTGIAILVNYAAVPLITLLLLRWLGADPVTAAGLLILAACPGAPYGPPFTLISRGNLELSLGLMIILAGSSALVTPLLLRILLPFIPGDSAPLQFDPGRMAASLLMIQLLPLFAGLSLRHFRPALAERISGPATVASKVLNGLMITGVLAAQYRVFGTIGWSSIALIALLTLFFLAAGYFTGGTDSGNRRTLAIIAGLRNMSLAMVIATTAFSGRPVMTVVLTSAVISGTMLLIFALVSGRMNRS